MGHHDFVPNGHTRLHNGKQAAVFWTEVGNQFGRGRRLLGKLAKYGAVDMISQAHTQDPGYLAGN